MACKNYQAIQPGQSQLIAYDVIGPFYEPTWDQPYDHHHHRHLQEKHHACAEEEILRVEEGTMGSHHQAP